MSGLGPHDEAFMAGAADGAALYRRVLTALIDTAVEVEVDDMFPRLTDAVLAALPEIHEAFALRAEVVRLRESNSRWQDRCVEAQRERDALRDDRLRGVQKARADAAEATLAKVRALHHATNDGYCDECSWRWPCETIRILDGEEET